MVLLIVCSYELYRPLLWGELVIIRELAGPTVQAPEYKKPAHDTTVVAGFTSCSPQSG